MSGILIVLVVLLALPLVLVFSVVRSYNMLVGERLKVDNQWSQIDVKLKERSDLIPNLVECVSGLAAHEKNVLKDITDARSRLVSAGSKDEEMSASNDVSRALGRLFAVAENYPALKSDTGFLNLQNKLAELEKSIADYRQFYNDTVMRYNRALAVFPTNILAQVFKFSEREFFRIDESDRALPKMEFDKN